MKAQLFPWIDKFFLDVDRSHIRRTRNIRLIPDLKNRRGGKLSYAEWAHVAGIFQTIIYQTLTQKTNNKILDIGCGTGLLGISAEPFIGEKGSYTGIDVMIDDVDFCQQHYKIPNYKFLHLNVANPSYASEQSADLVPWPIARDSQDLVTALSVWTHLREEDAIFYFREISRVLKKGGRAMVTFFLLDEKYEDSLKTRSNVPGRFHMTNQDDWIFDKKAYQSENWFTVKGARNPEDAIGISKKALDIMLESSKLKLVQYYPGNWKEEPGIFFQDILIFEKEFS